MVDTVAQCLTAVKEHLDEVNAKYSISMTRPTRNLADLDDDCLYVIRQQIDTDGIYHLIVAAKVREGKC